MKHLPATVVIKLEIDKEWTFEEGYSLPANLNRFYASWTNVSRLRYTDGLKRDCYLSLTTGDFVTELHFYNLNPSQARRLERIERLFHSLVLN